MSILVGTVSELTVRQEGECVLLLRNGQLVASFPWQAALLLSKALRVKGKAAEEVSKRDQIIADQAILTRLGVPFGLSDDRYILKAAANEAAWNTDLRRYIRPDRAKGIKSQEIFGRAKIIQHAPRRQPDES